MRMHFAMCRPDQSVSGLPGWLIACLLAHMCGLVYVLSSVSGNPFLVEPHLISIIFLISDGTGTGTKDQERNTALCAHPLRLAL